MTFSLQLTRLKAKLYFPQYHLPPFLGNKFRGGFGSVLLKAVCSHLKPSCNICKSVDDCLYHALYTRDRQKRGKTQPVRPIVFIPPFFGRPVSGRGELTLYINVFGDYIKYLPHIIYGLRYLGKMGLNATSKYEIVSISDAISGKEVYDGETVFVENLKSIELGKIKPRELEKEVEVEYLTPIEAKTPINLPFLIHIVRRRLILFVNEYGGGEVPEFYCEAETLESSWEKHELHHRSKRQGLRSFFGVTGRARYSISEIDDNALTLLSIGELIGGGAKASFGMGFFRIRS